MTTSTRQEQAQPRAAGNTVNDALTPNRRRPVTENSEYAAFVRRILRAYSRRIATGDVESLADLVSIASETDGVIGKAVDGLREAGYSWAEIAVRLGITRQAAHQRWGKARK